MDTVARVLFPVVFAGELPGFRDFDEANWLEMPITLGNPANGMPFSQENSNFAMAVIDYKPARFPETDLKQVFPKMARGGKGRKCLKNMVGRTGIEPVAR